MTPAALPTVTNPEKVLWPKDGLTKADLSAYYERVAPRILPYLHERPLTLERYPDGIEGKSFFEKNAPPGAPSWLQTAVIASGAPRGAVRYVLCNDARTLLYLANLATITLHVWQSRIGSLERPDVLLFDLDPGQRCRLRDLAGVAVGVRDALGAIGLRSQVKTSGATGLHVLARLDDASSSYGAARRLAEIVAGYLAAAMPERVTTERALRRRPSHSVYVDYAQVAHGKTFAAPFAVRARAGAPVSMPLGWAQLEDWLHSRVLEPTSAFARWTLRDVDASADAWSGSYGAPQSLAAALEKAEHLLAEERFS